MSAPALACAGVVKAEVVHLDDLAVEREVLEATLSVGECATAARWRAPGRAAAWRLRRGHLRRRLGEAMGQPPHDIALTVGPHGKPAIVPPCALHFNVAASGDLMALVIARHAPVGVDIEVERPLVGWRDLAAATWSPRLCARLLACPPATQRATFWRLWTVHEALAKGHGRGLPVDVTDLALPDAMVTRGGACVLDTPEGAMQVRAGDVRVRNVRAVWAQALRTPRSSV